MSCTSVLAREKGEDYIDDHHLFLVEDGSGVSLEVAAIRQPYCWCWKLLEEMVFNAGFSRFETRELTRGASGEVGLNAATR